MKRPIYLDNQATTPLDPRVLKAMMPYLTDDFGNAASNEHPYGWAAQEAVDLARSTVAAALGASAGEILFTSGATESNNLAIWGCLRAYAAKGDHVITVATEHHAVLDPIRAWQQAGGSVTILPVDRQGLVQPDQVAAALTPKTVLVSVMAANNEIGVLQPIAEIGRIVADAGVIFHSDLSQAAGKIAIDVLGDHLHLASLSAHKFYGPKGVGALYVRRKGPRVNLTPLFQGGGHERGFRSGTLNVPGIVGMATALQLAMEERDQEAIRLRALRDHLCQGLMDAFPRMLLNGHPEQRLPGNLNIAFPGLPIAHLVKEIYMDVALSTGAACTSASPYPSHVLAAIEPEDGLLSKSSLRLGLGRFNTEEEIQRVLEVLLQANALKEWRAKRSTT